MSSFRAHSLASRTSDLLQESLGILQEWIDEGYINSRIAYIHELRACNHIKSLNSFADYQELVEAIVDVIDDYDLENSGFGISNIDPVQAHLQKHASEILSVYQAE